MNRTNRHRPMLACAAIALSCAGCMEADHTAQWYMSHADELQSKLAECKKYPSLNDRDTNCKAASNAFATLIAATSHAAPASPDGH